VGRVGKFVVKHLPLHLGGPAKRKGGGRVEKTDDKKKGDRKWKTVTMNWGVVMKGQVSTRERGFELGV